MADDVIDLTKGWKSANARGRGLSTFEVGELSVDLRATEILEDAGPGLVDLYKTAVGNAKGGPTASTVKRRGPGALFRVGGEFLAGVRFEILGRAMHLTTGRLSKTVPGWLQKRAPGVRARNLLQAAGRLFQELAARRVKRAS